LAVVVTLRCQLLKSGVSTSLRPLFAPFAILKGF
jgi:hypothetical protein